MIWNIVDHRKREYRWLEVNAVIEDTSADNCCDDTDHMEDQDYLVTYEEKRNILLHDAISWAENSKGKVTLFLYDKGDGIG